MILRALTTLVGLAVGSHAAQAGGDQPALGPFRLFDRPVSNRINTTPHPAVVRIAADEGKSLASGSGSFVAARGQYGLVVTNWHVVRDVSGPIEVVFPDGFRSSGTILGTDKDWDLAALLIWRPKVTPLTVSSTAPQPGDVLTIAGYGQGDYQAATGKCTQYVAPSTKHPYEIVELSAQARQGDSGGPILNAQGELAGVLFGASRGSTSGSYCGRVRWFLTTVWPDLDTPEEPSTPSKPLVAFNPLATSVTEPPKETDLVPIANSNSVPPDDTTQNSTYEPRVSSSPDNSLVVTNTPPPVLAPPSDKTSVWESVAGKTRLEQAKTIFAVLGILAVWGHLTRWMAR